MEIIFIYCENYMKRINIFYEQQQVLDNATQETWSCVSMSWQLHFSTQWILPFLKRDICLENADTFSH